MGRGIRENHPPLTFIARDQRPAFSLEVGWDDVAEAVRQDVVCFVVDVLPPVGTGLKGQKGVREGKAASRATVPGILWKERGAEQAVGHLLSYPDTPGPGCMDCTPKNKALGGDR